MNDVERVFTRYDANGDGKISPSELADLMRALGSEVSDEELKAMMAELDSDGDGFRGSEGVRRVPPRAGRRQRRRRWKGGRAEGRIRDVRSGPGRVDLGEAAPSGAEKIGGDGLRP
ncbi:hypothetical protein COCNU_01G017300 [Cocos nucifera]|uniref:EF-hand domain-containing protein n=1 Tax=Cocos nucifera TaxID=13894 RepID=A0A8K0HWI4_COCNU|nr:hypothetical protein COCNU_01G017300 [Cocos nucifera]